MQQMLPFPRLKRAIFQNPFDDYAVNSYPHFRNRMRLPDLHIMSLGVRWIAAAAYVFLLANVRKDD
jgi:hypothetical protein